MLRSFHCRYSSLLTLGGLLEKRLNAFSILYLRTSSVNLRVSDKKDDNGQGLSLNYKGKIPLDNEGASRSHFHKKGCAPRLVLRQRFSDLLTDKLTVKYARSSGPGGQNVNKVNTKVDLRFHVSSAEWIPEDVRYKILEREKNRINKNGELFLSSMKTRSQLKNLEDVIQKVEKIIEEASYVPPETTPEKKAHVRKLIKAHNEKRLRTKKFISDKKRDRKQE